MKTFRKKIGFGIWLKITLTAIIERKRARLYTKSKKIAKRFYMKKAWHFSKSYIYNFLFVLYTKSRTLDVTGFSWNFWSWHLFTKSMTLCVTSRFYIQKARQLAKSKIICDTFLYTKIWHFCVTRFFIEFLKFAEGGGTFIRKKNNVLSVTFLYWKTMHFALRCYIQRALHYALQFNIQKQYTFLYVYMHI